MRPRKILIVGSGIAGLSLRRLFRKSNIPYDIVEKRVGLFSEGAGIALPANAMKAFRYLDLGSVIAQQAHRVNKIIYTEPSGEILNQASLLEPPLNTDWFVALPRHKLHTILAEGIHDIEFNTTIKAMQCTANGVLVSFDSPSLKQEEYSAVIGADGINSQVRQLAFADHPLIDLHASIWRWTCQYPTNNLHPTYMLGAREVFLAYPIGNNEVYCYAHVHDSIKDKVDNLEQQTLIKKYFSRYGGVAKSMLNILPDNKFIIPGRLRSVFPPVFSKGRIALVGDAAHACSPMLQQGAAAALEDCISLTEFLQNFPVVEAFEHYEKFRHERVNWIVNASDTPMKTLVNVDAAALAARNKKIRDLGPLNVLGWRMLLAKDFFFMLDAYIEEQRVTTKFSI